MRVSIKKKLLQKIRRRSPRIADKSPIFEDSNSPSSCGGRDSLAAACSTLPRDRSRDENHQNENCCPTGTPSEIVVQYNVRSKIPSSSSPELSRDVCLDVGGSDTVSDNPDNVDAQQEPLLSMQQGPQISVPAVTATTEPSHPVYSPYIYHQPYPQDFQRTPQAFYEDPSMMTPYYIPQVHYVDPNFHPTVLTAPHGQADQNFGAAFEYPHEDGTTILDASMQELYVTDNPHHHFDQALHLLDLSSSTTATSTAESVAAIAAIDDPSMQARKEAIEATAKLFGIDHPDTRFAVQSMQRHAIRMMG